MRHDLDIGCSQNRVCNVDGVLYRSGDPIPTEDPCETCKCRPPGFACTLRECEVKPNCKAVRREGQCCPEYHCGCEQDGKFYKDGEVVPSPQSPCYVCYCQGSSISCSLVACQFRGDCEPRYVDGECCPRYDHCPPTEDPSVTTTVQLPWSPFTSPRSTGRFFTTRFQPTTIPGTGSSTHVPGGSTRHGAPVTRFEPTTIPGLSHRAPGAITKGGVLFTRTAFPTSTESTKTTERFRPEQTAFPSSLYDDLSSPQPVPDVTNPVKRYTTHLPPPEETESTSDAAGGAQSTDSMKPLEAAVQSQDVDDKLKSTVGKDAAGTTAAVGGTDGEARTVARHIFPATIVPGAAVPVVPAVLPEAGPVVIANVPVHPVVTTVGLGTVQPTVTGTVLHTDGGVGATSSTGIQGGAVTGEGALSTSSGTVMAGADHSGTAPAVETYHGAAVDSAATTGASVGDATHALAASDATTQDDASSPMVTATSELHNGASSTGAVTDASTSTSGVNTDSTIHAMATASGHVEGTDQAAPEGVTASQTLTPGAASVSTETTSTSGPTDPASTAAGNVPDATVTHTAEAGTGGATDLSAGADASSTSAHQSDSAGDTAKKASDCGSATMLADAPAPASAATDSSATNPIDSKSGPTTGEAGSAATSSGAVPAKASGDAAPVTGFADAFPAASNGDATSASAPGNDAAATTTADATPAPASGDATPPSPSEGAASAGGAGSDTEVGSATFGSRGSVQDGESSGSNDITPAPPASPELTTPATAPSPSVTEDKATEQESSSESNAEQPAVQGADQTTTTAASVVPEAVSTTVGAASVTPSSTEAATFGDSQPSMAAEEHPLGDEPHHDEGVGYSTEAPKQEDKPVTDAPASPPVDEHPLGDAPVVPDVKTEENEAVPPKDSNESGAPQRDEKSNDVSDSAGPADSATPVEQGPATDAFGAGSGTDSTSSEAPKSEDTTVSQNVEREEHPEGEPEATTAQPAETPITTTEAPHPDVDTAQPGETPTTTTEAPHHDVDDDSGRTPVSETPIVPEEAHTVSPDNEAEKPEASTEPPQNDAPPSDDAATGDSGAPHDDGAAPETPVPAAEGGGDLPPIGAAPAAPEPAPQPAPTPKSSSGNGGGNGHGHEHKPHVHHDYGGRVPPTIEQLLAQLSPDTRRQYELDHGIISTPSGGEPPANGGDSGPPKTDTEGGSADGDHATPATNSGDNQPDTTTPSSADGVGHDGGDEDTKTNEVTDAPKATEFPTRYTTTPPSAGDNGHNGDASGDDDKTKSEDATAAMTHDPIVQLVKAGIPDLHLEGAEPHRDRRRSERRAH
ncbi:hypothetical protein HPB52_010677 [Rhipicephalus sanguineus]|uniref:VWFC domain-containing protein n=1 Tax=Rhipicephalus sanguineus TaxID=34632 RepID=A0A9D4PVN6_RHISA|nr:hypothetical protein HPB52_010677 [Rhipicephalus sanguineus]